jgi:SAM-dependent methyltransferase
MSVIVARPSSRRHDGWNHNAHYHEALIASMPPACRRALDVGCGLGAFARRLSAVAGEVDAIESDATVVRQAREASVGFTNVHVIEADFMSWTPDEPYDFVSMIAVVHHLPFDDALRKAARVLRPGGVLAVLGLDRPKSLVHAGMRNAVAFPASVWFRLLKGRTDVGAPIREPQMTLDDIRTRTADLLPGAVIRRLVLWRYLLVWTRPR